MNTATKSLSTQELSAIYDRIYDIADRLIKKHNPCNIRITKKGICCEHEYYNGYSRLCCGGCDFWSENGCTVKCLACKLLICWSTRNNIVKDRLEKLRAIAHKYDLPVRKLFMSKKDWLKCIGV